MEKVLSQMPGQDQMPMKAGRILEINPNHAIFKALEKIQEVDIKEYADLLYNQALLIEGFEVEDPIEFSNKICDLMIKASQN